MGGTRKFAAAYVVQVLYRDVCYARLVFSLYGSRRSNGIIFFLHPLLKGIEEEARVSEHLFSNAQPREHKKKRDEGRDIRSSHSGTAQRA